MITRRTAMIAAALAAGAVALLLVEPVDAAKGGKGGKSNVDAGGRTKEEKEKLKDDNPRPPPGSKPKLVPPDKR